MTVRPDYRYWSLRELWEVRQAACLLLSVEPGTTIPAEVLFKWTTIVDTARDAMDVGILKPFNRAEIYKPHEDRRVRPAEFLAWWQAKGFKILTELAHLLDIPEAEGLNPAESKSNSADRFKEPEKTTRAQQEGRLASVECRPGKLDVIVDDVNETVTVFAEAGKNQGTEFMRSGVVGKGVATWDLLVAFAKCNGSLEGNTSAEIKKINKSANRINLGNKLMTAMGLDKSPIIEGRNGVMRFSSIQLAGGTSSSDALDRKTTDDQTTEFLQHHGDDMPVD